MSVTHNLTVDGMPWPANFRWILKDNGKEIKMKNQEDNRVLSRLGARELTEEEENKVAGAIGTATKCTPPTTTQPHGDGDKGECGYS